MSINLAIELMLSLLARSAEIGALISKLNLEGRTEFTPEEWAILVQNDDAGRQRLADAIEAAKARAQTPQ